MQSSSTQTPPPNSKAERSVGELLTDLAQDTSTLVRQEVSLATAEITQKVAQAAKALGILLVGLVFAFLGLEMLVNSGVIFLADRLAGGKTPQPQHALLAFFIVFGLVTAIGTVLIITGIKLLKANTLVPEQTVETLKEDVQWAKQQTR